MDRISLYVQNPIAGKTGTTKTNLMVGLWEWFQSSTGVWVVKIVQHDLNHYLRTRSNSRIATYLSLFYETLLCSGLEASFQSKF
jgi:hypothetical protein